MTSSPQMPAIQKTIFANFTRPPDACTSPRFYRRRGRRGIVPYRATTGAEKRLGLGTGRLELDHDEARFTREGRWCRARIAHIDCLSAVRVVFGVRQRVIDITAVCRWQRDEGHYFVGPRALGIRGRAHHNILRERRAIDGEVALEIVVPGDAQNAGVIENRNSVINLRGPIPVAGVERPRAAILRTGWCDFAELAFAVVVATVGIERSITNEGGG